MTGSTNSVTPTSCWITLASSVSGLSGSGVGLGEGEGVGVAAVSGVAVTTGVGLGSGVVKGVKPAANAPRPMLAVSATAVPPAASLYSGSRTKVLPEKYRIGFFLLNIPVPHSGHRGMAASCGAVFG